MPRRPRPDARRVPMLLPPDPPGVRRQPDGNLVVSQDAAAAALLAASASLEQAAGTDVDPWAASPFRWLKTLSAPSRGRAGVELVELLLRGSGFAVTARTSPGHDLQVESVRTQVRFSTLWSAGWYTFQKVRDAGDYEVLVLVGISPDAGHAWLVDRATVTGSTTDWWTVDPATPPGHLDGGRIDEFLAAATTRFGSPSSLPHGPARIAPLTGP